MVLSRPEWMAYYPPSSPSRDGTDLFRLIGGRAYLIKLGGNQEVVWRVTGQLPSLPMDWLANGMNFAGFCVDDAQPPTFAELLAFSPGLAGQPLYRLNSGTGKWERADPATARMRRGEAFWISSGATPGFLNPVRVESQLGAGLEFGRKTTEIRLELTNQSDLKRTIRFDLLPSSDAPTTSASPVAGPVPLSYYKMDLAARQLEWIPIEDYFEIALEAGQTTQVRFQVRRKDMTAPSEGSGPNPLYQSLLRISDGTGSMTILPVSANNFGLGMFVPHPSMPYVLRMGLWVGTAQINGVCEVNNLDDRVTPKPVASAFSFPLLIHADQDWNVQLLSEAFVMRKPDAQTKTSKIVVLTDRSLISRYEGIISAGQELVGRRFSSAAFGSSLPDATSPSAHHEPLVSTQFPISMQTDTHATSPILTCTLVTDYDDPLNPFKHKYHPDHDNLSERFDAHLPEGSESYEITRVIELEFTAGDPFGRSPQAGWGDTLVGGNYAETITGIHRYPIRSEGVFVLHHIVGTTTLNDP